VRTVLAATLVLLACRGGASPPARQPTQDTVHSESAADTAFPTPRRGMLAAHPVGPGALGGEWAARATHCADPRMLQVLARGDTVDLLIVLWLPADSVPSGSYAVLAPDSVAAPRTARVAAQRMLYADVSYRGQQGTVWLERLDQWATGRFDVVMEGSPTNDHLRYLGRFSAVPVDSASGAECRVAGRDSSSAARGQRPMLD